MEGLLLMTPEETQFATMTPTSFSCVRCDVELRSERRNGSQSNKETDA
jgi:hypothetical protein